MSHDANAASAGQCMEHAGAATRHVVGVMTGTSIDAMDAALVRLTGQGLDLAAEFIRHASIPLDPLRDPLRNLAGQQSLSAGEIAWISWEFGQLHVRLIESLLEAAGTSPQTIDLIAVHGQTVFHEPPISWQLVNTAPIAHHFGVPVVSEMRQADLAAGGQGAPIMPLADWMIFRHAERSRAIVNLGGFCNISVIPAADAAGSAGSSDHLCRIRGLDVCACNQVLDAIARQAYGAPYDDEGSRAAQGMPDQTATSELIDILQKQGEVGRSLGTGDEAGDWVNQWMERLSPEAISASAAEAIGQVIARASVEHTPDEVILGGGGARHATLISVIHREARRSDGTAVYLSDEIGIPIHAREAIGMAVLGALCADGVPITIPHITGCDAPAPVAGTWRLPRGLVGVSSGR